MATHRGVPEATIYRLSLYHCYLWEYTRRSAIDEGMTSRTLSELVGIREATVRRDLSYLGGVGRAGVGYRTHELLGALQEFLGVWDDYPMLRIGSVQMLQALEVVFPVDAFGVRAVGYFSESADDVGAIVGDIEVRHVTEIPELGPSTGAEVALVACAPSWIDQVLELLNEGGISGALLLTPKIGVEVPPRMHLRQMRIPCDIKTVACALKVPVLA